MNTTTTTTNRQSDIGRFAVAAVSLAGALACGGAAAQASAVNSGDPAFAPGRILVMPRAGLPDAALGKILNDNGGGKARRVGSAGLRIVDLPRGLEKQAVDKLARHPHIKFAELDQRVQIAAAPNDPYFGSEWHLSKINATAAWDSSTGTGVTIAVLDTGVDGTHPDLAARMVPGWNFINNNSDTTDVHGHGTAVAGSAAATLNNGIGVAAVAGLAKIMPLRIADANAYTYWSTVAQAVTWAADRGARVANISYVGVAGSLSVQNAAQYMKGKGGLVVVSAGNNNKDEGIAPTTTMIPVSATDPNDAKTSFSSWGNFVAVSAPGINIWTTTRGGGYGQWWGTSIASPVTAGVVALMMASNSSLSSTRVESLLYSTAVDLGAAGRDSVFGYGRVNAAAAVAAARGAVSTVDTQAPSVAITSPGASTTVGGLVSVNLNASDNVGVTRVDLQVNGSAVTSDTSAPFAFSWDSAKVANGMATLTATAYDAAGNKTTSAGLSVNVSNVATTTTITAADTTAPTVTISSPANGSTVSGTVSVADLASDNSGSAGITQTLYINGIQVASATGSALSYSWNTRKKAPGSYTLQFMARDAAGNSTTRSVTVSR